MEKKKIKRDTLEIEFEDDVQLMRNQIGELERLKRIILESPEFKILDGKTQMVGTYKEEATYGGVHSRGEHTVCVAKISKKIVTGIYEKLGNEEERGTEVYQLNQRIAELYAEIMGYAHDLGHTPFGHVGESGLNDFMEGVSNRQELNKILKHRRIIFGIDYEKAQGHNKSYKGKISFEHNEQSANLFYDIVQRNHISDALVDYKKIIWGILGHSVSRVDNSILPNDLSVRAIRMADKIEYINRDYEELRSSLSEPKDSRVADFIKDDYESRVEKVINDVVDESFDYGTIDEEMDSMQILNSLKEISNKCVMFVDEYGKRGLVKDENVERLKLITYKLAEYFYTHKSPELDRNISWEFKPLNPNKKVYRLKGYRSSLKYDECRAEKVIRFVSSMENARCHEIYKKLVLRRILMGPEYGIEPIISDEIEKKKEQQLKDAASVLKVKYFRLSDDERIQKVKNASKPYIEKNLSQYGREQIKQNREKHLRENGNDFFAHHLMIIADGMRNIGKSKEEITMAILAEMRNSKDKEWKKIYNSYLPQTDTELFDFDEYGD